MTDAITLSVAEGRRYQERSLAKRRKDLEAEEEHLAQLKARDAPPAPPKAKPSCWVCGEPVISGRNMGVIGLISPQTVLAHAPTGEGAGCWTVLQRARATVLPHCKIGPKLHDKSKGDRLLRAEVDRMLTLPKFQAEIASQWQNSYHLTTKSPEAIRLDRIENEMRELQVKLYGVKNIPNLSDYQKERDLAEATKRVDDRQREKYVDPDIEFEDGPASREENYPGEHTIENER